MAKPSPSEHTRNAPHDASRVSLTVDGEDAYADLHEGGEQGAILIHGLASSRDALGPLPSRLAKEGFTVLNVDLRGHGQSQGERGLLLKERVLDELTAWGARLEDEGSHVSLLAGHSLGGLWALAAAPSLGPERVAALASPASVRDATFLLEEAAYWAGAVVDGAVRRFREEGLRVPYRVSLEETIEDEDALERARAMDDVHLGTLPVANARTLLTLDGAVLARDVSAQALVARASMDRVVDAASSRRLREAFGGEASWMTLEGGHALFLDAWAKQAADAVASWASGRE